MEVEQNDKVGVPDLGERALALFFFGKRRLLLALDPLVGLVADFEDLYFGKRAEPLRILLFQ